MAPRSLSREVPGHVMTPGTGRKLGDIGREREERFRLVMAERGIVLERPSGPFRFRRSRYLPDFFSPTENAYYEVLGSSGPADRIPLILDLMDIFYPSARVICVKPSGEVFDRHSPPGQRRYAVVSSWPFGAALLRRMGEDRLHFGDVARRAGIDAGHFSRITRGKRQMSEPLRSWLEAFARGSA